MRPERFLRELELKSDKDYGLMPYPIDAQEGLNILIDHFLGKDWYVVNPISTEQVNTEAIYEILKRNPKLSASEYVRNLYAKIIAK